MNQIMGKQKDEEINLKTEKKEKTQKKKMDISGNSQKNPL